MCPSFCIEVSEVVAVADGRDAHRVLVHSGSEALSLLDELISRLARSIQVQEVVLIERRLLNIKWRLLEVQKDQGLLLRGLTWEHGEGREGKQEKLEHLDVISKLNLFNYKIQYQLKLRMI